MEINTYLESVFGKKVYMKQIDDTKRIPRYLREDYDFYQCSIQNNNYTFLFVKEKRVVIERVKKQLDKLRTLDIEYPVLILNNTRRQTRNKLIANQISFIDVNKQMYIPYICLIIDDTLTVNEKEFDSFTPLTQLVFIAILMQKNYDIHSFEIQEKYKISAMTLSRALRDLVKIGLLNEQGFNTRKKYQRIDKKEYWNKGKEYLINPIRKKIYIKKMPNDLQGLLTGDSAMAYLTMLNEPKRRSYAIYKDNIELIKEENIIDSEDALNEDCIEIEVWNYNPFLLTENDKSIDVFSLYALYKDSDDARIEIELEQLLEENIHDRSRAV